jgi:hypothetical protein
MTANIVPVPGGDINSFTFMEECRQEYLSLTPELRLEEGKRLYSRGLENALRLAALVWAANARGDDMGPFRRIVGSVLWVYIDLAKGNLIVSSLRKWGRELRYLMVLKRLTPADQERLCNGPIPVFERAKDGTPTHRQLELDEIIESGLARQVFDRNMIRTQTEQEVWLKREERKKKKVPQSETFGSFELNDEAEEWECMSRRPYSLAELDALVKEVKRRRWGKKG